VKRFSVILVVACLVVGSFTPHFAGRAASANDACETDGSLCAMLNLLPDLLNDPSGSYDQVYYDNYAEHLRRFGFTAPTTFEGEDWDNFRTASYFFTRAGSDIFLSYQNWWEEQMGYSPFLIDQRIAFEHLPYSITLFRGRFDRSSVESFWSQTGYKPNEVNGTVIWKLRGDLESKLIEKPFRDLPTFNYAIFVRDDVIAYSSTAMGINATFQTVSGSAPSLAANTAIEQLLANVPSDLASAVLGSGGTFANSSTWTLFGITPGGPATKDLRTGEPRPIPADTPLKRAYAALLYGPGVDLNQKANEISSTFLSGSFGEKEKKPYTDYFQDLNVIVDSQNQVVAVDFAPQPDSPISPFAFLFNGDLGFLV
jgi:hypothetical protein